MPTSMASAPANEHFFNIKHPFGKTPWSKIRCTDWRCDFPRRRAHSRCRALPVNRRRFHISEPRSKTETILNNGPFCKKDFWTVVKKVWRRARIIFDTLLDALFPRFDIRKYGTRFHKTELNQTAKAS
ncbi:hypothetical protein [Candidatus Burkholderia verschuerenii]|uniref:hypothetical protein n=1 Tax=Candidatus Burkholderia verschuerenii TaxID=242163 RepID=UPI0018DCF506|nr:hypothetical protein [Candidatus Burkholderia verschuerenii]